MPLAANELNVLAVVVEKGPVDAADCARLAAISPGIADATLRSLVNKGLATANKVRQGLSKKPDGTYSATRAGHAELAA
jgi:DNA-binding PadR family transcriptional regulator